jgi:type IV secretion system protein VirD4
MHNPTLFIRICVAFGMTVAVLALGYPAAFIVEHGWNSAAWSPNLPLHPTEWFQKLPERYLNVALIFGTYWEMLHGISPSFAGGGFLEISVVGISVFFVCSLILLGGSLLPRRDASNMYGNAGWASQNDISRMSRGLEIGINPETGRSVRIQVEGNLVTIAPPRTGKTGGFIIPNLIFSEEDAWDGPAVVIDPKGDAYRATRRHREAMGRTVRCLDPLNFVGGTDRWNPLSRIDPHDVLYLQSMALALLPQAAQESESGAYFRSRAVDLIVAAILVTVDNGRADPVSAAKLLMDREGMLAALQGRTDQTAVAARRILMMEERSRENITSTAEQATQWLRDERMQAVVQNHTFELSDLSSGEVDLFIVLPADDSKKILAPYVRWLLSDLFSSVRKNKPAQRIVAFIDEAFVLGRFGAILEGAGELPGYGISLWTFWQSRHQMIETYGPNGADTLIGTAEMINIFNLPAAQPEETEYWSKAIGTYTGVKLATGRDAATGKVNETVSPEAVRLVPATALPALLQNWQVMFLTSTAYTPAPVKLRRTLAYTDPRFDGLIDIAPPVGRGG